MGKESLLFHGHQLQLIGQFKELNLICECSDCDKIWESAMIAKTAKYNSYESNTSKIIESIERFITNHCDGR